jgi:hypothetical protein
MLNDPQHFQGGFPRLRERRADPQELHPTIRPAAGQARSFRPPLGEMQKPLIGVSSAWKYQPSQG